MGMKSPADPFHCVGWRNMSKYFPATKICETKNNPHVKNQAPYGGKNLQITSLWILQVALHSPGDHLEQVLTIYAFSMKHSLPQVREVSSFLTDYRG